MPHQPRWQRRRPGLNLIGLLALLWAVLSWPALAAFGLATPAGPTGYRDPAGRYQVTLPAGWTYQPAQSRADLAVFFGTGEHDVFYVEVARTTAASALAAARDLVARFSGPNGLRNFQVLEGPGEGQLAGQSAAFLVYAYADQNGTALKEGRGLLVVGQELYSLTFTDTPERFDANVAAFNQVLSTFQLTAAPPRFGLGGGGPAPAPQPAPQSQPQPQPQAAPIPFPAPAPEPAPAPPAQGQGQRAQAGPYIDPAGFFTLVPHPEWEFWEVQATEQGDTVDPTGGAFGWRGRPMSRYLFLWNTFDDVKMEEHQYQIIIGIVQRVPGTITENVQQLGDLLIQPKSAADIKRVKLGDQNALRVRFTVAPGWVRAWQPGVKALDEVTTFYVLKKGTTLAYLMIPNDIEALPEVQAAIQSFVLLK